jgi:NDP-sugar pyrophosphorylase family protein
MTNPFRHIDVFILCGGFGKRLRCIAKDIPKPMVKIGNQHFLDILIKYIAHFGFRRFILGIGYKADIIKNYYLKNKTSGLKILFSCENTPLDTGGAVKKAKGLIRSNPFFVLNGDSFCEFNPLRFLKFHEQKKSLISILLCQESDGNDYGRVRISEDSRILSFDEKEVKTGECLINTGIYLFDKKIFSYMPSLSSFSLERDLFPMMTEEKIYGYPKAGFFIDIGTPERYLRAKKLFFKEAD